MKNTNNKWTTKTMVLCAILTAIVIVLQFMGASIKLGPFSVSLVLIPIAIGASMCGVGAGAWLGFVFGVIVLMTDAGAFLAINPAGTVITVLLKGLLCGMGAGFVYRWLCRYNIYLAAFAAALICPVINTGVFLLGCLAFFMPALGEWASAAGLGDQVARYMIFVLVGANFLFEVGINVILSPIIVRLLQLGKKQA